MDAWLRSIRQISDDQIVEDPIGVDKIFTFELADPQISAIQASLAGFSESQINDKINSIEVLGGSWPGLVAFMKDYAFWCAMIDPEHPERCFEWYGRCYQSLQKAYSNSKGAGLNLVIKHLTSKILNLFGNNGQRYLDFLSSILIRLLNSVRSEREPVSPTAPAKKDNILFYANMLSRIYFKSDQLVSAGSVYSNMHSVGVILSQFTMAEQVEYRYWVGRYAIYRCDAQKSYLNLQWALDHCLYPSPQYNIIWDWILIPAILVGKLPTRSAFQKNPPSQVEALQAVSLTSHVVKSGKYDLETIRRLRSNAWVKAKNLWPLIEAHLPQLAYRRVLQRIQIHTDSRRIPFELTSKLIGLDDPNLIVTEGIICELTSRNLITCNVLPQSLQCIFKKTNAFPPLVDVNKAYTKDEAWMSH